MNASISEPLPSVIELGRALAAVGAAHARADDNSRDGERVMHVLEEQEDALRQLITAMPATTLMDAAVQISVVSTYADTLAASDWEDPASHRRLHELHKRINRATLSVLPLIAAAAGLNLEAMGWGDIPTLRAHHFGLEDRS